ncbi:MAG TPA: hypothetical protein VGV13_07295 [Methylomirabilota bacterium]|jgi:hypothetical protein|nr:hypothetical protein [Methylomirabilota bacterium]
MAEPGDSPQDKAYRVGFKRSKREDYAVDMLQRARGNLEDPDQVDRILRDIGRYYNAIADQPIVSLEERRQIVESLRAGRTAEAAALLDACLGRYQVQEDDS